MVVLLWAVLVALAAGLARFFWCCCAPPFAGCTYTWSPTGCFGITLEDVTISITPPVGGAFGISNGCSASVSHTFTTLGTYTWQATHSRFSSIPSGSFTVTNPCSGTTTFAPAFTSLNAGYACTAYCGQPPKVNLTGVWNPGSGPVFVLLHYNSTANYWDDTGSGGTTHFDGGPSITYAGAPGGSVPLNSRNCCALVWDYSAPGHGDFGVTE